MAKLIYVNMMSVDGFIGRDKYDWAHPGDEGLNFIGKVTSHVGTYLYGRKTFETMAVWDDPKTFFPDPSPTIMDYARVWQAADKVVFSKTLKSVSTKKTRLEPAFDPQAMRALKAKSEKDISVGGPELAAHAIRAGIVDEYQFFLAPAMIGGGIPVLPKDISIQLELIEEQRFGDGFVHLRYRSRA